MLKQLLIWHFQTPSISNFNLWIFWWCIGGGHSVGIAPCVAFENRLYDFQNTGKPDPTMNTTLLKTLQTLCPRNSGRSNSANLLQNPRGSSVVDKSYYEQIRQGNELLRVGQLLALDPNTTFKVDQLSWELLKSRLATKGRSGKNGELLILPNWNSGGNFCALVLIEGSRQQNYFRRLAQFCSICDESF